MEVLLAAFVGGFVGAGIMDRYWRTRGHPSLRRNLEAEARGRREVEQRFAEADNAAHHIARVLAVAQRPMPPGVEYDHDAWMQSYRAWWNEFVSPVRGEEPR